MKKKNNKNHQKNEEKQIKSQTVEPVPVWKPNKFIQRNKSNGSKTFETISKIDSKLESSLPPLNPFIKDSPPHRINIFNGLPLPPMNFQHLKSQFPSKNTKIQTNSFEEVNHQEKKGNKKQSEEKIEGINEERKKNKNEGNEENIKKQIKKKENLSNRSKQKQLKAALIEIDKKAENLQSELVQQIETLPQKIVDLIEKKLQEDPLPNEQFACKQITKKTQQAMIQSMGKNLQQKVDTYFKEIMRESKQIYDQTESYYNDRIRAKSDSTQYQITKQQQLISNMRIISGGMKACLHSIIVEGEQLNGMLLQEWQQHCSTINSKLDKNKERLELYQHDPEEKKQKILENLTELKQQLAKEQPENKPKTKKRKYPPHYLYS